jgi:hypothetical protein
MRSKLACLVAVALIAPLAGTRFARAPLAGPAGIPSDSFAPQPVVIELFTSEGCSSCPPADAFLKQLDDAGRVNDVEIIAIEEHVDYWDRLGWRDPFSSHQWTERQEKYSRSLGHDGIYTPQLVVNGRSELVGKSSRDARREIIEASKIVGAKLLLSTTSSSQRSVEFSIVIENIPIEARSAQLLLAVTERGLSSNVLRGENEGRNLSHAAVLRSLSRVSFAQGIPSGSTEAKARVALDPSWKRENLRFVILLQDSKTLHILGAAGSTVPH